MDDNVNKVTSELYEECDCSTDKPPRFKNNVVSIYNFSMPKRAEFDTDGDLLVATKSNKMQIEIEHSKITVLKEVGLQLWRGAFLLADWIIYNSDKLSNCRNVLELATGVGLTGIVSSMYAPIILTDIDNGKLLQLITENVKRNASITKFPVKVQELDFTKDFNSDIQSALSEVDIILAADVIYDDALTEAFVNSLRKIVKISPTCEIFVALEKRYVFTVVDLDTCAPCLEYFREVISRYSTELHIDEVPIDFAQYFEYNRVKQLVLYRIVGAN